MEKFLQEKGYLVHTFKPPNFIPMSAKEDVFQNLNDLNLLVQGKKVNIVTTCDLLHAFR